MYNEKTIEKLKQRVLNLAIRGKLVPQDENDEPASVLIEKLRKEKEKLIKEGKIKKPKEDSFIFKGSDNCYYENINGKIKNIQEEIPFEIPESWSWCRLDQIAQYNKGPFGSNLTKDMFVDEKTKGRVKVYEQKNAIEKNNKLGRYYISSEKFELMKSYVVYPNDIIVSCAGTIGEIYKLPKDAEIGIINQALMRIKLYSNVLKDFYLIYFNLILKNESNDKSKGTGMKNIPPFAVFKKMLIALPPEKEIPKIIKSINAYNNLINRIENDYINIEVIKNSIKFKLLNTIFGDDSSYKSYYENKVGLLKDFCKTITKGTTPTTYGFDFKKSGIPFIKVENVNGFTINKNSITCYIDEKAHEFQKRSQLQENDILFSIAGTIGKMCIITNNDIPSNTNQAFAIIRGYAKHILPKFLLYYLYWINSSNMKIDSHGGGMNNATLTGLKSLEIWFPIDKKDQETITKKIDNIFELIDNM